MLTNCIKYLSSMLIIISMVLTAANIWPLNIVIAMPATIGWIYLSYYVFKDISLTLMNTTALVIYLLGLTKYLTGT